MNLFLKINISLQCFENLQHYCKYKKLVLACKPLPSTGQKQNCSGVGRSLCTASEFPFSEVIWSCAVESGKAGFDPCCCHGVLSGCYAVATIIVYVAADLLPYFEVWTRGN